MKKLLDVIKRIDGNDILILLGLGAAGWSLFRISPELAAGSIGAVLLLIGLIGAWRKGGQ